MMDINAAELDQLLLDSGITKEPHKGRGTYYSVESARKALANLRAQEALEAQREDSDYEDED